MFRTSLHSAAGRVRCQLCISQTNSPTAQRPIGCRLRFFHLTSTTHILAPRARISANNVEKVSYGSFRRIQQQAGGKNGNERDATDNSIPENNHIEEQTGKKKGTSWRNPTDVLKELDKEKVDAEAPQDVSANFDDLRSLYNSGEKLDREDFMGLRKRLHEGFTASQLTDYIEEFEKIHGADTGQEAGHWKPGISPFLDEDASSKERISSRISYMKKEPPKCVLAERIMRDCWRHSITNEIGQLDIRLSDREIFLLLNKKIKPLKSIASSYNAKIDVSQSLNLVRIRARESTCEDVRIAILNYAARVGVMTVKLVDKLIFYTRRLKTIEPDFIRWLQNDYGVWCEKDPVKKKIDIYYLEDMKSDAEEACRGVELYLSVPLESKNPFCTYYDPDKPAFFYPYSQADFMPWPNRYKQWLRWAKAPRGSDMLEGRVPWRPPVRVYDRDANSPLSTISESLLNQQQSSDAHPECLPGRPHVREIVVASVGKCIFRHKSTVKGGKAIKFQKLSRIHGPRTIATDIPNTHSFLQQLEPVPPGSNKAFIHRFRLFPWILNDKKLPPIDIEFEVPKEASGPADDFLNPIIKRITAAVDERMIDMLLPETSLDLRFTKTSHYDLFEGKDPSQLEKISQENPVFSSILDFSRMLNYRLPLDEVQLSLPISCDLTIPTKLLSVEERRSANSEFVTGRYLFPPLQSLLSSRTARFIYKDFEVNYARMNNGPFFAPQTVDLNMSLGRYDNEVRPLTCNPGSRLSSSTGSLQRSLGSFYTRACQMAFEIGAKEPAQQPTEYRGKRRY